MKPRSGLPGRLGRKEREGQLSSLAQELAGFGGRFLELLTARLALRVPDYNDASVLHSLLCDSDICRYTPHAASPGLAYTQALVAHWNAARSRGLLTFVISKFAADASPFGLAQIKTGRQGGEISFLISPQDWGRGYAAEALAEVLALGLRATPALRPWAICDAENQAAGKMLAKIGLLPDKQLPAYRKHPAMSLQPRDCILYRQAAQKRQSQI